MPTVNFERGFGGYTFSAEEIAQLTTLSQQLLNNIAGNPSGEGLGVAAYDALYNMLTEWQWVPNVTTGQDEYRQVRKAGVDAGVCTWVAGAKDVNSNTGLFAGFIREYTIAQLTIRGMSISEAPEQIANDASNEIASRLLIDIIDKGTLPSIEGLGAIDAGVAASKVFVFEGVRDYSPWAGTLLFPVLGTTRFYRELLLGSQPLTAVIPNFNDDEMTPVSYKYTTGTYDLLASLQASEVAALNAGWSNLGQAIPNLVLGVSGVPYPNQAALIAETTTWFNNYYGLPAGTFDIGKDVYLNSPSSLLIDEYDYFVGKYDGDTLVAGDRALDPLDGSAIMNGGAGNDSITGANRGALTSSVGNDLLDGGDGNDTLNGGSGNDYLFGGMDDQGNDLLRGQDGNDYLHGGAGNDSLIGGEGGDTLQGGTGTDRYELSGDFGKDTILDADGLGLIQIDGQTLSQTRGTGQAGVWVAEMGAGSGVFVGLAVYDDSGSSTGKTLVITRAGSTDNTITVKNFDLARAQQPGGYLGIELSKTQLVALVQGGTGTAVGTSTYNTWSDTRFEASVLAGKSSSADQGASAFTVSFSRPVLAGETMTLELSGALAGQFKVNVNGTEVEANGAVMALTEGQTFATFALIGNGSPTANLAGNVSVSYQGIDETAHSNNWGLSIAGAAAAPSTLLLHVGGDSGDILGIGNHPHWLSPAGAFAQSPSGDPIHYTTLAAYGGGGNDLLFGFKAGTDTLDGGTGDDVIFGGYGGDSISGGDGNDVIASNMNASYSNPTITSDPATSDIVNFSWLASYFSASLLASGSGVNDGTRYFSGPWEIREYGNGDLVSINFHTLGDVHDGLIQESSAEPSNVGDTVSAGAGDDTVWGGAGADLIQGEAGNDQLTGLGGADIVFGGMGNDSIFGDHSYRKMFTRYENRLTGVGPDYWSTIAPTPFLESLPDAHGDDFIDGGDGHDLIAGDGGSDILLGGIGNDSIWGDSWGVSQPEWTVGHDFIDGGEGDDRLYGGAGNDSLLGGAGADVVYGDGTVAADSDGADHIEGGAGNDTLIGGGKSDTLSGGDGADVLHGDLIDPLAGDDDVLLGGGGNDTLIGNGGNDLLMGEAGDDYLMGQSGNDTLDGGAGNAVLDGGEGDDVYTVTLDGQLRNTTIRDEGGQERILVEGSLAADSLQHGAFNYPDRSVRTVNLVRGDSRIYIENALSGRFSLVDGSGATISLRDYFINNNNTTVNATTTGYVGDIQSNDAVQELWGGTVNDTLTSRGNQTQIWAGRGNDTISLFDSSDDTIHFRKGDGKDVLRDLGSTGATIELSDEISYEGVYTYKDGNSLNIKLGDGDLISIDFGSALSLANAQNSTLINQLRWADGRSLSWSELLARAPLPGADIELMVGTQMDDVLSGTVERDVIDGLQGNDSLSGGAGNDTLDGGAGNDQLSGGAGADTYFFGRGSDQDTIENYDSDAVGANADTILLGAGITATDVTLGRLGDNLIIRLNGGNDNLTVSNYFNTEGASRYAIENLRFADGTVWDVDDIKAGVLAPTAGNDNLYGYDATSDSIAGGEGNDTISGLAGDDVLVGNAGLDYLQGGEGNDYLQGNEGNDYQTGDAGNDTLDGGAGNDYLLGGAGADTYLFGSGSGQDFVNNYDGDAVGTNADTILLGAGITTAGVTLSRSGDSLIIRLNDSADSLTVSSYFYTDGTSAAAVENLRFADGTVWNVDDIKARVLTPTAGNDSLYGYATSDTIAGGEGNDAITGLAGDDVLMGNAGLDYIQGGEGNDNLQGNEGNDNLTGDAGNDTLDGGTDNDYLSGGTGADTYLFERGSGQDTISNYDSDVVDVNADTILLGADVATTDVTLNRAGDGLIIRINGSADSLTVSNYFTTDGASSFVVENLRFADGTVWNVANVKARVLAPTAGNDTITGYASDDTISGSEGNDAINGQAGNDVLDGGNGTDTVRGGDGNDTLRGGAGNDTVFGDSGQDELEGGTGNDDLQGGVGDDRLRGHEDHDLLYGGTGADTLEGGGGNDVLYGGDNNDTYLYARGDGNDLVSDTAGTSTLRLGIGIAPDQVTLLRVSSDLVNPNGSSVIRAAGDSLIARIANPDGSYSHIDFLDNFVNIGTGVTSIQFENGAIWDAATINDRTVNFGGVANVINGSAGNDTHQVDHSRDAITELLDGGVDTVVSSVSYTLGANLENLTLTGDLPTAGIGNGLSNTIVGNSADNFINSDVTYEGANWYSAFVDTLIGGAGNDTYKVVHSSSASFNTTLMAGQLGYSITEEIDGGIDTLVTNHLRVQLVENVENIVVTSTGVHNTISYQGRENHQEAFVRYEIDAGYSDNRYNDFRAHYVGNGLSNVIDVRASGRAILIDGGAGMDTLMGGGGDTTYMVDHTGDLVVESGVADFDVITSSIVSLSAVENVEVLELTGSALLSATGNSSANDLRGSKNTAANTLTGGAGDDSYFVDVNDVVIEAAGGGIDTVVLDLAAIGSAGLRSSGRVFSIDSYANVENLAATTYKTSTPSSEGVHLVGNDAANGIYGSWHDDILAGGGGDDHIEDSYSAIGWTYAQDTDLMYGGEGNDVLVSLRGNDTLWGDAGNDVLQAGQSGLKQMHGGSGDDTYRIQAGGATVVSEDVSNYSGHDVLVLESGFLPESVSLHRDQDDLIISNAAGERTVVIDGFYTGNSTLGWAIDEIRFTDSPSTVWTAAQVASGPVNHVPVLQSSISNQTASVDQTFEWVLPAATFADLDGGDTLSYTVEVEGGYWLPEWLSFDPATRTLTGTPLAGHQGDISIVVIATDVSGMSARGQFNVSVSQSVIEGTQGVDSLVGTARDDVMRGLGGADTLAGQAGNDALDGGSGADLMQGGEGNDTYWVDSLADVVVEDANGGVDVVFSSVSYTLSANTEQLTLTGSNSVNGTGNTLNNVMQGNSAANTLNGAEGADAMAGGAGDDTYVVDNIADSVSELAGEGFDSVQSSVNHTLSDEVEGLRLTGTDTLTGTGNALGNAIEGNASDNTLWALAGNDTLTGGQGNDYLSGGSDNDVYVFNRGDGQDTIDNLDVTGVVDILRLGAGIAESDVTALASSGSLFLNIRGGTDRVAVVNYYAADTTLNGQTADRRIDRIEFAGGAVWDQATIQTMVDRAANNRAPTVSASLPTLQARAGSVFGYTVAANTITDPDAWDSITYSVKMPDGSAVPAWLAFDATTRTLSGTPAVANIGSLQFVLWGTDNYGFSAGTYVNLTVAAANRAPVVSVAIADQTATQSVAFNYVVPQTSFTDPDSGDTLSYGATLADGSALPSWLVFNAATRTFSGTPTAAGVVGVRVTAIDSSGLSVFDVFNLTVNSANPVLTGTAGADTLTGGSGNDSLSGLAGNDTLVGGAGNDVLNGGAGNDNMQGGAGDDTYHVDSTSDVVTELAAAGTDTVLSAITYTLGTNVENLGLTGSGVINGTGNTLNNVLTGNSAANTLSGGTGVDTMSGGLGNDTYVVDNTADVVIELSGEGTDLVQSNVTYTLANNLENLTLTGTTTVNGTGNASDNVLTGNSAANVLTGGAGNDTYVVGTGDTTVEAASAGTDTVQSAITWTLATNVENLTLTGSSAVNGIGNALDNVLVGNSGKNALTGGAGNDTYVVGTGDTTVEAANAGTDTVQSAITWTLATNVENLTLTGSGVINGTGNTGNNVLVGNSAANTLTASAGNDTLNGAAGVDSLVGGAGNDTYVLGRGYGIDTITENDSTAGNADVAQFLSGIAADQLWFAKSGNNLNVSIIGTNDRFSLTNWYLGNQYHVEQFQTSDGKRLMDSQVQNLVNAMAAFSPPAVGQTTLSASQSATLMPVIAANWQ